MSNIDDLDQLSQYRAYLKRAGRADSTIIQRIGDIKRLRRHFGNLHTITRKKLHSYLDARAEDWSPAYRKKIYVSYRLYFTWAKNNKLVRKNPARSLPTVHVPRYLPRPVPEDIVLEAFDQANTTELAMLCLASVLGLRRSEIAALHPKHRDGKTLRVLGKGAKERNVPLDGMTYSLLCQLESEQGTDEYYFPGRFSGHIHPHTVYVWLKRHLGTDWSTHNLRHRAASHGLQMTRDLRGVQELLGHQSLDTTQIYTHVDAGALQDIVNANSIQHKLIERRLSQILTGKVQQNLSSPDIMHALQVLSDYLTENQPGTKA